MAAHRQCPQCGAAVELPEGRVSDLCAFCETPLVDAQAAAERVDLVAGFDLDARQAAARLRRFLQDHRWAPEPVRQTAAPERLHGVLVPFYAYDGIARSRYNARVGLHWYRTESYTVTVNGRSQRRTRQVRETEWFDTGGFHVAQYTHQLVSGSRGLPEAEANQLEPFDLGRCRPWTPALSAGWVAELPDIDHTRASQVAADEVAERENRAITGFLPGDTHAQVRNSTQLDVQAVQLVLLPVWIATYRWQGTVFRVLVNGQTGEVVGTMPRSPWKIGCAVALVLAVVAGLVALLLLTVAIGEGMRR